MLTRTIYRRVTFTRPFILDGFNRMQPAGSYIVKTEEEEIGSASVPAYRHVTSVFILNEERSRKHFPFDPQDLIEALERDRSPPMRKDDISPGAWRGMDWVRRSYANDDSR